MNSMPMYEWLVSQLSGFYMMGKITFFPLQDTKVYIRQTVTHKGRGVVVITAAQLHSTKPELRFCTGSNPARGVSKIDDGEDLWQWSRLEIRLNAFRWSTKPQKQFIIIIIITSSKKIKKHQAGVRKGGGSQHPGFRDEAALGISIKARK